MKHLPSTKLQSTLELTLPIIPLSLNLNPNGNEKNEINLIFIQVCAFDFCLKWFWPFECFLIEDFIWKDLLSTCNTVWSTFIFCCTIIALSFLETSFLVDISIVMCSFNLVFELLQLATARLSFYYFKRYMDPAVS